MGARTRGHARRGGESRLASAKRRKGGRGERPSAAFLHGVCRAVTRLLLMQTPRSASRSTPDALHPPAMAVERSDVSSSAAPVSRPTSRHRRRHHQL